jgi:prophage regulatory protein
MKMMMSTEGQTLPDDSSAGDLLPDRILRLPEVLELYPVSRSTWYEGVRSGRYPESKKISERSVGWRLHDILRLMKQCGSPPRGEPAAG